MTSTARHRCAHLCNHRTQAAPYIRVETARGALDGGGTLLAPSGALSNGGTMRRRKQLVSLFALAGHVLVLSIACGAPPDETDSVGLATLTDDGRPVASVFSHDHDREPHVIVQPKADPVAPLQPCVPQPGGEHWTVTYRDELGGPCTEEDLTDCDSALYECVETAPSTPGSELEYTAPDAPDVSLDCRGNPLKRIAFVAFGMAGELRYNVEHCADDGVLAPRATLLVFSGGGGTGWRDGAAFDGTSYVSAPRDIINPDGSDNHDDYRFLERQGVRIVAVRWQAGVFRSELYTGWMTRSGPEPSSLPELARRPAAVIQYVGQELTASDWSYAVAGTSGGSLQTASMLWHDVGRRVDYAGFHAGGGIVPSLLHQVGWLSTDLRISRDTGEACWDADACGSAYDDPLLAASVAEFLRYPMGSALTTTPAAAMMNSSFQSTPWAGTTPRHADYIVNNDIAGPLPGSDMRLGAVWAAGVMRGLLRARTGVAGSWSNAPGMHGQAMQAGHPSFAIFKTKLLAALR